MLDVWIQILSHCPLETAAQISCTCRALRHLITRQWCATDIFLFHGDVISWGLLKIWLNREKQAFSRLRELSVTSFDTLAASGRPRLPWEAPVRKGCWLGEHGHFLQGRRTELVLEALKQGCQTIERLTLVDVRGGLHTEFLTSGRPFQCPKLKYARLDTHLLEAMGFCQRWGALLNNVTELDLGLQSEPIGAWPGTTSNVEILRLRMEVHYPTHRAAELVFAHLDSTNLRELYLGFEDVPKFAASRRDERVWEDLIDLDMLRRKADKLEKIWFKRTSLGLLLLADRSAVSAERFVISGYVTPNKAHGFWHEVYEELTSLAAFNEWALKNDRDPIRIIEGRGSMCFGNPWTTPIDLRGVEEIHIHDVFVHRNVRRGGMILPCFRFCDSALKRVMILAGEKYNFPIEDLERMFARHPQFSRLLEEGQIQLYRYNKHNPRILRSPSKSKYETTESFDPELYLSKLHLSDSGPIQFDEM